METKYQIGDKIYFVNGRQIIQDTIGYIKLEIDEHELLVKTKYYLEHFTGSYNEEDISGSFDFAWETFKSNYTNL